MELKKPHPSRLVAGVKMQNELVPHLCMADKNLGGISQEQGVPTAHQVPKPRVPVPEDKPHNFWLQKPVGTESLEETSGGPSSSS